MNNERNSLNSILIEGNMVRDPQYRTHKGTPVCTFTLATNRYFKMEGGLEREVSFFDVETWSRLAESCNKQGRKGRGVRIVGRLRQDRWQGADGKPHARVTIAAEHVEFRSDHAQAYEERLDEIEEGLEEKLAEIEQDVLPDEEMADESHAVEVIEAVL